MGVAVDKPIITMPACGEHLTKMSYTHLNQLYSDSIKIAVDEYTAFIGGVQRPWSNLNEIKAKDATPPSRRIIDSEVFAVFQSKDSFSSYYNESPWKIHLSIHPDDAGKAWDLIYPLLLANNVPLFKTTRVAVAQTMLYEINKLDAEQLQKLNLSSYDKELAIQDILRVLHGMQITIYIEEGKEKHYNALLEEIEPLLYKAGIRPGIIDKSDRALGFYSSIRHVGESYTSHEKVTGYKAERINDPFREIKPVWQDVQINWTNFDYLKHIIKAKLTLQQVVDAQKKYEMAIINKREFTQACEVAEEYFTRWHKVLKKTKQPVALSDKNQQLLTKFKKWIDNGKELIPTIRKQKARKIKEAEDILSSMRNEKPSLKFSYPLKRHDGQRNLRALLHKEPELTEEQPVHVKGDEDTAAILNKLGTHRKKIFAELKSKSLSPIPLAHRVHKDPVSEPVIKKESSIITIPVVRTEIKVIADKSELKKSGFFDLYFGRFWGGIAGLALGLAVGIIFGLFITPLLFAVALTSTMVAGVMFGFIGGYFLDKARTQLPEVSGHTGEQQHLLTPKAEHSAEQNPETPTHSPEKVKRMKHKATSLPLYRSKADPEWDPRIFVRAREQDKAEDAPIHHSQP